MTGDGADGARKNGAKGGAKRGGKHVLVSGYPGFLSKRLLRRLITEMPRARFTMLVEESRRPEADADVASLSAEQQKRVKLAVGDVAKMDVGLDRKSTRLNSSH